MSSIKGVPKFVSPFAPLHLSDHDQRVLRHTTYALISESVHEFQRFLKHHGEHALSKTQWRLLQQRDDIRMFVQHDKASMPLGARGNPLSTLLAVGTVEGSVADNVYAVASMETARDRVREAHCKNALSNFAVLAVLEEPTTTAPFRTMCIRWGVKEMPAVLRVAIKHEDSVAIVATGITTTPTGDQIGYRIIHSIELPGAAPLKEYTRVELSTVTLWRAARTCQPETPRSQVYLKTFADLKTTLHPAALRSLGDSLLSVTTSTPHVTRMYKLTHMLRVRAQRFHETQQRAQALETFQRHAHCVACHASFEQFLGPAKHMCRMCRLPVCSSCSVKHKLLAIDSHDQLKTYRVRVCPQCWDVVCCTETRQFAIDELLSAAKDSALRGPMLSEFQSLSADDDSFTSIHSGYSSG